ncbi:MAG TPA: hypothetical protein DIW27_12775 [Cytophagales bacterium]|nr:hypothetical protein [Cytophagales bacterium]
MSSVSIIETKELLMNTRFLCMVSLLMVASFAHAGEVEQAVATLDKKEAAILYTNLSEVYKNLFSVRNELSAVISYSAQLLDRDFADDRNLGSLEVACNSMVRAQTYLGTISPETVLHQTGWHRINYSKQVKEMQEEIPTMHKSISEINRKLCPVDRAQPSKNIIREVIAEIQSSMSDPIVKFGTILCEGYNPLQRQLYDLELCRPASFAIKRYR